ncbi:hypothetical protein [Aquimarina pacifica]|uniref:hypothetical protein n=1 Tax=Aquimarina pacifica TaxID=1296415 RepID=UPI00046F4D25|nr:hypothetical protein [Aquimarina pacifica]
MKSELLIQITKEIETPEKTVQLEEYVTDLFVYTKQKDNTILYRKDKDELYTIDETLKILTPISLEVQKQNVAQFKKLISKLDTREEKKEKENRKILIEGKGNLVVLSGEVNISKFPILENSANLNAYKFSCKSSVIDIDINPNEILDYSSVIINVQGKKIINKTVVKEIKIIEEDINRYDYVLDYSIN